MKSKLFLTSIFLGFLSAGFAYCQESEYPYLPDKSLSEQNSSGISDLEPATKVPWRPLDEDET